MNRLDSPVPLRGTALYTALVLLLITVGPWLQNRFGLPGLVAVELLLFFGLATATVLFVDRQPLSAFFRMRPLSTGGAVKTLFLALLAWALAYLLGTLMILLVNALGGSMPETLHQVYRDAPLPLALLAGALIPALCEETAFRGYLLRSLGPLGARRAIIITGILFGAIHLSLIRMLPLAVLGMIFSAAVWRTGSILTGMLMHFVNNATALTLASLVQRRGHPLPDAPSPSWAAALFLLVAAGLVGAMILPLLRSLGPLDLAVPEPAGNEPPMQEGALPAGGPHLLAAFAVLLPGALVYAWAVAAEIQAVFSP